MIGGGLVQLIGAIVLIPAILGMIYLARSRARLPSSLGMRNVHEHHIGSLRMGGLHRFGAVSSLPHDLDFRLRLRKTDSSTNRLRTFGPSIDGLSPLRTEAARRHHD